MAGGAETSRSVLGADAALTEAVRRLVDVYRPDFIYLFGSVARGEAGPDSDFDLLVVVADTAPPQLRRAGKGYEALWGLGVPVDIVVWTRGDFDRRLHLKASLPATVLREGVLLHAA
ncbi:MAG: nucleotidyltransferase domain-containing protein [Thermoleophilia bacterium]|nr:nucleotidyltransferase domain-containing protein [Thermoleophilia bacterium]